MPDDYMLGRVLAHNVVDTETGEILANANDEITEDLLAKLQRRRASSDSDASTPTTSTRGRTSRRPCASTRPPTSWRRASPSTA